MNFFRIVETMESTDVMGAFHDPSGAFQSWIIEAENVYNIINYQVYLQYWESRMRSGNDAYATRSGLIDFSITLKPEEKQLADKAAAAALNLYNVTIKPITTFGFSHLAGEVRDLLRVPPILADYFEDKGFVGFAGILRDTREREFPNCMYYRWNNDAIMIPSVAAVKFVESLIF